MIRFTHFARGIISLALAPFALTSGSAAAETPSFSPEQIEFFEAKVRPVLADSCYDCHTGSKAKTACISIPVPVG